MESADRDSVSENRVRSAVGVSVLETEISDVTDPLNVVETSKVTESLNDGEVVMVCRSKLTLSGNDLYVTCFMQTTRKTRLPRLSDIL